MGVPASQNGGRSTTLIDARRWAPGEPGSGGLWHYDARVNAAPASTTPKRSALVLAVLILVAVVANMNLAVCNVALPDIARALDAGQTELNLTAVAYSLGLAASVLYFGAIGDRYGRKQMLLAGMLLAVPASLVAAWAPNVTVLIIARIAGGLSAGMAYPTTLALITALWSGPARVRSIALWSAIGGAAMALSASLSGWLVMNFWWGSVFVITVPLAAVAALGVVFVIPSHVNENSDPVDNLGGVLSIFFVGSLVLAINFVVVADLRTTAYVLFVVAILAGLGFGWRQFRAPNPLYEPAVAKRRTFWVAAVAGLITFGSLMGSMFVGQQYLQNVLGYSPVEAGAAVLPLAVCMMLVARLSAELVVRIGSRNTLGIGFGFLVVAFICMYALWSEGTQYWAIALAYGCVGFGVGFAGTPASQSLTTSAPVRRVGMASGTADLQRDLGGSVIQSILGALLTAGYATSIASQVGAAEAARQQPISDQVVAVLQKSFGAAADFAAGYPEYEQQIIAAARNAFVSGQHEAFGAAIILGLIGIAVTFVFFPNRSREQELEADYHRLDSEDPVAQGTGSQ